MNMQELDRQAIKALTTYNCPKCGEGLQPVHCDGAVVGFDCLKCQEYYDFDNIYCT